MKARKVKKPGCFAAETGASRLMSVSFVSVHARRAYGSDGACARRLSRLAAPPRLRLERLEQASDEKSEMLLKLAQSQASAPCPLIGGRRLRPSQRRFAGKTLGTRLRGCVPKSPAGAGEKRAPSGHNRHRRLATRRWGAKRGRTTAVVLPQPVENSGGIGGRQPSDFHSGSGGVYVGFVGFGGLAQHGFPYMLYLPAIRRRVGKRVSRQKRSPSGEHFDGMRGGGYGGCPSRV